MKPAERKQIMRLCVGKSVLQIIPLICGERLGGGTYRDVFVLKQNPDYVVKLERHAWQGNFANVTEWRNYINNREWKWFSKWLAPCEMINETGEILIQRRIIHGRRKDYPKHIPVPFTDLKLQNFGWIGKQFVCCDYSFIPIFFVKVGGKKMKFAKWWGSLKK